ncbi:MAG: hypothetical protein HZB57_10775, partial [Gammaproteobacteria bacterium]|nr:hypothetical protein [Gammaproteobacteria bacterium]
QYKHGELQYDRFRDLKLVRDVHGRYHPVCKLAELHKLPLALAPADKDDIGKALHDRKLAFVLSPKTLEWFEVDTVRGLLDVLASRTGAQWLSQGYLNADVRDFDSLKSCVGGEYFVLKDDEVDATDLHALEAIRKASYQFPNLVGRANSSRKIFAGKSETSLAWTDGATYIAIEQGMLRNCRQGLAGFLAVVMALADRYLYSRSSLDGEPDADHLEEFHNLVSGPAAAALSTIAVDTFHAYIKTLRDKGIKIPRDVAVDEDMDATFDWLTTEPGDIKPN